MIARRTIHVPLALAALLGAAWASAAEPGEGHGGETAEDRKGAAKAFAEGQKAFNAGDYRLAAGSFEQALRLAPRLAPLWNAARAWQRAGELSKAANLYARYLREAPAGAPDRNTATASLREIEAKLGKLEIHAAGVTGLTVDGARVEADTVYVSPGSHLLEGRRGEAQVRQTVKAEAGSSTSVTLLDDPPPPPAPPPAPPPPPSPEARDSKGLPPAVVFVGAGLTAVGAGLTVWSGLSTWKQNDAFDKRPTQSNLDEGLSRQHRTNLALGVTGLVALSTVGVALFFTDWGEGGKSREADKTGLFVGPGQLSVRGAF